MSSYRRNAKKKTKAKNFIQDRPKFSKIDQEVAEIEKLKSRYETFDEAKLSKFQDFPLSKKTLDGLRDSNFIIPTEIQKESIGFGLKGRDILGAAITGSGKTLAFLIPIIECLYVKRWTRLDGLGAIIISPTRELAYQIFETLKKVGVHHDFSAALVIGGKNLKFERKRMDQVNIMICTPGRLLQHMDENPLFNCDSMQVLVLDEADRILDLGFEATMNSIIENFPSERQTLLFSATQTKSVKDLARLSLKDPVLVAPHAQRLTTPANLKQNYVVIELQDKITMLWSFIKNHLKHKVIVFMSSCKQVKFFTEIFTKLRAGTPIFGLYGTLHQDRRVNIYNEFMRKSHAVLISTDVASRGLDFPVVNWVIQYDCPEDATAYIHRAGRTARHNAKGESLLVLLPSEEEGMVAELKERQIEINKIFVDPKRMFSPRVKMEAYLAQITELKATAQRAFVSYIKSVYLMKNKKTFDVDSINYDEFAKSFGLIVTPRIRFLEKRKIMAMVRKKKETEEHESVNDKEQSDNESESDDEEEETYHTTQDKASFNFNFSDNDDESGDDLIKLKRKDHDIEGEAEDSEPDNQIEQELDEIRSKKKSKPLTKAALAKKVVKKQIQANRKVAYDDEGNVIVDSTKQLQSEMARILEDEEQGGGIDIEKSKMLLREEDQFDKQRFKDLVKARHKEKKRKLKEKRLADDNEDEDGNQDQDDFGSDDEEDNGGPDLSWLPDPDKIYGKKESDDDVSEEEPIHKPPAKLYSKKTRKSHLEDVNDDERPMKKRRKKIDTEELSLTEAEAIAMKLLGTG